MTDPFPSLVPGCHYTDGFNSFFFISGKDGIEPQSPKYTDSMQATPHKIQPLLSMLHRGVMFLWMANSGNGPNK